MNVRITQKILYGEWNQDHNISALKIIIIAKMIGIVQAVNADRKEASDDYIDGEVPLENENNWIEIS